MTTTGLKSWLGTLFCLAFTVSLSACGAGSEPASPDASPARAADGARPSILLIVVDTLRADHLGIYGYERATSPNIDALARDGVVFELAQATSSWTLPSMASLLTGWLPSRHGCGVERASDGTIVRRDGRRAFNSLANEVPTLAERLARHGYSTAAFVSNNFLRPTFGLERGFDHYDALYPRNAPPVVEALTTWFDERSADPRPFFVLAHFMDPHLPYAAGGEFRGRFTEGIASEIQLPIKRLGPLRRMAAEGVSDVDRAFVTAAYDEEIAFVDAEIGRLLQHLEASGALENTLVLLTSDHGEELFEHGGFEHGHSMYQELLHVPLIISGAGLKPARIRTPVSLVDVAATLVEATGAAAWEMTGRSLLSCLETAAEPAERALYSEGNLYGVDRQALLAWPKKLNAVSDAGWLFDLERDPHEMHPLNGSGVEERDDEAARLGAVLKTVLEAEREQAVEGEMADLDEEMGRQLEELGYAGGDDESP